MVEVHPKFLTDGSQRREAVVLSMGEWQMLLEELEELEDIRAYDAAKAKNSEALSFEQAVAEIESE